MITCASLILGLHLVSHHSDEKDYQNNVNSGVYAECDGWTAGAYKNTYSRLSVYGGYVFRHGPLALNLGLISGYRKKQGQAYCPPDSHHRPDIGLPCTRGGIADYAVIPMIAPSVTVGPVRLFYLPRVGEASSVFHLALQQEFK